MTVSNPGGRYSIFCFLLLLIFAMGGCSATGKSVQTGREDAAGYDTKAAEEVIRLEGKLAEAIQAGMPFLAPTAFRTAQKSMESALKELDGKARRNNILASVAEGESALEKGHRVIGDVRIRLREELAMKVSLEKLDFPPGYGKEFEKLLDRLSSLIQAVELDKSGKLEKEPGALLKDMRGLQVRTIKHHALNKAQSINEQTRKDGGDKEAPVTSAKARTVYEQAEKKIEANPLDERSVSQAATEALFAARHAQFVADRVVSLKKQFKASPEEVILEEEARLHKISLALQREDLRDRPLEEQASELVRATKQLMSTDNQRQLAQAELDAAQKQLAKAQVDLERERAESKKKEEQVIFLSSKNVQLELSERKLLAMIDQLRQEAGIESELVPPVTEQ